MPVTAYIAVVGASMHTHDTVKCIYTRPVCQACMSINIILLSKLFWKSGQSNLHDVGQTNGLPNIRSYFVLCTSHLRLTLNGLALGFKK